ncbi:MAG TPA: CHRD domain-containing protein [Gaiellaceae bacterium]
MKKLVLALAVAALGAMLAVSIGLGATRSGTKILKAKLTAGQEVPKPKGVPAGATGAFTGKLVGNKLTWKLTFKGLSGRAMAAHIHMGKPGKAGNVIVVLCPPRCVSGRSGTAIVKKDVRDAIEHNLTYVNVHTAKNPGGEIRGQVKTTES